MFELLPHFFFYFPLTKDIFLIVCLRQNILQIFFGKVGNFFFFFKLTVYVEFNLTVLLVFWENYFPQPVAHL